MNVLALNPGSSSLKFGLFRFPQASRVSEGAVENVAAGAMSAAVAETLERFRGETVDAVGCRVVHGGSEFSSPTLIDDSVLERLRAISDLAPIHNPPAIDLIESVRGALPGIPVIAVFDTSFHQTLPDVAAMYAIPDLPGVRRYGFHGISYSYVTARFIARTGTGKRLIIAHLGNGASVCAIRDGKSVDTSMGFTPTEGLMMGTRSGDLDPGVILFLLRQGMTEGDLDELLNRRSGLLAVSGKTGDVRELEEAASRGHERAELALEMFAYRAAKYIGAYAAALGGLDALVFTAGIGERSPSMRDRICRRLAFLGITLDEELNVEGRKDERCISSGSTDVWVIPTDEEIEIARQTASSLRPAP